MISARNYFRSYSILNFGMLICLFILNSCSYKNISSDNIKSNQDVEMIVFLVMKMHKNESTGNNSIILLSSQITEGKIKTTNKNEIYSENYLNFEFLKDKKRIEQFKTEHPLYRHIEFQTDTGLTSKSIVIDSIEFFERFQLSQLPDQIRISEKRKDKETLLLNKIPIQ
ncbi:MAG: hypothetical protein HOP11_05245 [Saprospiraceae bacterium]|nr:hypothetical protein [Saprospiraceae bacterium]